MAQTTILAAGTDATLSTEFTIGAGDRMKVGLFPGAGNLDLSAGAAVFKKGTPAPANPLAGSGTATSICAVLGNGAEQRPVVWICEPGTYYVQRSSAGVAPAAFGVYTEPCGRNLY